MSNFGIGVSYRERVLNIKNRFLIYGPSQVRKVTENLVHIKLSYMKLIRYFFYAIIRYSGLFLLLNKTILRRKVAIVLYHDPKPDVFISHITFLRKYYNFISLDLLVYAIYKKNWEIIPNNSMVVTFDDGHAGNFLLFETIQKYKVHPIFYVCSGIINTNRHFWWKETCSKQVELLKRYTNKNRLTYLKKNYNYEITKEYSDRHALNLEEIKILSQVATFGSHSCFHPILTSCDSEDLNNEIFSSKEMLEKITNKEFLHFCYPNGDYNDYIINQVKKAGYISSRTIDVGWNDINTDPFKLRITGVSDDASINKMVSQLTGITMFLRYLSRGSLQGKHKTIKPRIE